MSTFPSTLTSYTNPLPTNRLNAPSHSSIEGAQNSGISQVEAVIGVAGANSVVGTFEYDVRSPASGGGGHIQTAILGGTGQTTYNKGDLLTGQSASVLGKLAIGLDGQLLSSNSSTASGVQWINNSTPKLSANPSMFLISGGGDTSIMTTTLIGSLLGTSNVVVGKTFIGDSDLRSSVIVRGIYGGSTITSVLIAAPFGAGNSGTVDGQIVHTIFANNATGSQKSFLEVNLYSQTPDLGLRSSVWSYFDTQTVAKDGGAAQNFGATAQTAATGGLKVGGYVIQKIT